MKRYYPKFLSLLFTFALLITACGTKQSSPNSSAPETPQEPTHIDVELRDELRLYSETHESTPVTLNQKDYNAFIQFLDDEDYSFSKSEYYGLDEALDYYHNTKVNKKDTSDLLDASGNIDADKLLSSVKQNNERIINGKKNAINTFYEEMDEADKIMICDTIANVCNTRCDETERKLLANSLTAMTMFTRGGSASNAYVTRDLTFIYNPTMTDMYADTRELISDDTKEDVSKSVIIHEIMHLIQHKNNDLQDENGIEIAICRDYNLSDDEKKIPVNTLYTPWILEASAELGMADYLGIDTHTYDKKISYVRSYNFSQFNTLTSRENLLETMSFSDTLEEFFEKLNIKTKKEQMEYLKFSYSIEIIQSEPDDFWEHYTALTGETPTDDEKLQIRMEIRSEIIKYLSRNFYKNLAKEIYNKNLTDMDSVFYLMRLWELDCFKHLEYTKIDSYEAAKPFIQWQDNVQQELFKALASNELAKQYDTFLLQTKTDETVSDNCNLSSYNDFTTSYIFGLKEHYKTNTFAKNKDMITYLEQNP